MAKKKEAHEEEQGASTSVKNAATFASDTEALFVGIDLGTSSSVIAASNGVREVVPSFVGFPKDNIAEELLGNQPLFGEAALKHRLSVNLVRPLAKGVIQETKSGDNINLKAAQLLVKHLLHLARPKPGQPVYGVIGAPARASIASKRILVDSARGILNAVMICSEPFSVAYGLGILDRALIIDIGAGTTDLCRLHGTLPTDDDQITFDVAGDYVDNEFAKAVRAKHPDVQFTINMIKTIKEQNGFVADSADKIIVKFPVKGRPQEVDVTAELRAACRCIVPPTIDAIAELIGSYDPEFQEELRNNVILAGGGSQMVGLPKLIEQGMKELGGGKVRRVEEPVFAGANGALKMAKRMPKQFWQMLS
ncbi:MAG: rod shape-determining protein [Candidatus Omnitrophica bacterium]|nr:rod shape-determining protein [Candidatus Omnitrophota bacterium]